VAQGHNERMSSWRGRVLAAEARKAGIASDDTLRTPRPPCAILLLLLLLSNKGPKVTYKSHMYKIVHRKDSLHFTYSTTFVKYASWSHPVEDWVHDGETFRRLNNGRANVTCLWQILSLNFNFYSGSTALNWLRSPGESVRYKAAEPLNFIGIRQDAVLIRLAIVTLWPSSSTPASDLDVRTWFTRGEKLQVMTNVYVKKSFR